MERIDRRNFLKQSLCTLAGLSLFPALRPGPARADGDYKALVFVFLFGGADSFNMVVPKSDTPRYDRYAQIRGGMAIPRDQLLDLSGSAYGFHPRMTRMQELFNQGRLAVVGNVGVLNQPIGHQEIAAAGNGGQIDNLPDQLRAHNTQTDLWMLAGNTHQGWAARTADLLDIGDLVNISLHDNLAQQGGRYKPLEVSDDIYEFLDFLDGDRPGSKTILGETFRRQLQQDSNHVNRLVRAFARARQYDIDIHNRLAGIMQDPIQEFGRGVHETGKSLGEQLELVTRLIEARTRGGFPGRQIFCVGHDSWDTHNEMIGTVPEANNGAHKVDYLDKCVGQFFDVMQTLGIADQVTLCTGSEFGRTVTSNGRGTDHGWGGHAFVCGGAVRGGFFGTMPDVGQGSADMLDNAIVPTTSVEQYLAGLVNWLGDGSLDLDAVFPNLSAFDSQIVDCMRT